MECMLCMYANASIARFSMSSCLTTNFIAMFLCKQEQRANAHCTDVKRKTNYVLTC